MSAGAPSTAEHSSIFPSFRMESLKGRGFAMGHRYRGRAGGVSLSFTLSGGAFSLDAVTVDEAREIARALTEAADYAETGQREAAERIEEAMRSRGQ